MKALARIGVLVEVRAVEVGQPVLVVGKVRRHPVENHADAVLVQVVHQVHEILRRAVAAGGREVAGDLVSPRAVERVLHDGHELDVGEAEFVDVVGEPRREFAIAEPAIALFRVAHPGAEVHFVDRHGRVEARCACGAGPSSRRRATCNRGPRRSSRCAAGSRGESRYGSALFDLVHVEARAQVVLVDRSLAEPANEALPHARVATRRHGVGVGVPAVEVAHHGEAFGVGRPDREVGALMAVDLGKVRAQLVIETVVSRPR